MADTSRQSAFMPTIKCSNCGNQVEISMMGDHVCGSTPAPPEPPPPPIPDLLGSTLNSLKVNMFGGFGRSAPPAVDTNAANRAFAKQDQLTPRSASTGSQAISPKTPNGRPGASPSRDDFGPAIASSPRRPGGYGGFGDAESYEGDSTYGTSPNKSTNFLTRMNSIAPGPFDSNRRPGSKNSFARNNSRENLTVDSIDTMDRPGTSGSTSSKNSANLAPPRAPRANGYGGFGAPQRDSDEFEPPQFGFGKRSETFPEKLLQANDEIYEAPARAPSAPGPRPDRLRNTSNLGGQPTNGQRLQRPSFGAQDALRPPPRGGFARPPTRDGNGRPSVNLAEEFGVGNPYHASTVSQSSSSSGYSHMSRPSQASSSTSPARSVASRPEVRRPSDTSNFDSLMDDLQASMDSMQPKGQPPSPTDRLQSEKSVAPLRSNDRRAPPPEDLPLDPASLVGRDQKLGPPLRSPVSPVSPEHSDRKDPAVQTGLNQSPPTRPSHNRQPSRSRGNCKACKLPITGKSISSADGRLTGRYHKACFVCTTCQEPFSSSTFYVLNDQPYCEQHYHKLNGSLCGKCNRGIEGQYLEDESSKKYHPGCFRCGDCGTVLRDGYFDVDGKAYCERDAWKRMQFAAQVQRQGPPPGMQMYPPRRPSTAQGPPPPRGLPSGPGSMGPGPRGPSPLNRPFGLPTGNRLAPGQALGRGGLVRMEKRMTRLGMM
ncbi:uncharacterized protein GGS22DRAFT_161859 [Annulohypoxylon maeteangense]|uniref:uncharacterized protein n=1 Tax=Annulohypoxylon maeteangense TaxID=1927788 RepID=UPI002008C578|nr:uncharacterized protein GGS22DRAFT_161859 [Annulohypoxylon maeteangense]KAI0885745.1 hypothetical protein GGS22DRAFT_161859 [Annulohypoxylon maeteangense]